MLKGIPERIGSDLLKAMADMGHGDLLVIADDFYPAFSRSPDARVVQAKGNTAAQMLDAILTLLPIDTEYSDYPVEYMVPDIDSGDEMETNPVWDEIRDVMIKYDYEYSLGSLERSEFYGKARNAFVVVSTSEREPFGCIIIQKGVK